MKTCQILVDPGATVSTLTPPQSLQMGSWESWQQPAKCTNSYQSLLCRPSVCDARSREKNKISGDPFFFKSRPIGYWPLLFQRTAVTFSFVLFGSWELGFVIIRLGAPIYGGTEIWVAHHLQLGPTKLTPAFRGII